MLNRELDLDLSSGTRAPAVARLAVANALEEIPGSVLADVQIVLSELVTNAIRHAPLMEADHIAVRIQHRGTKLRIEVEDPGPCFELTDDPDRPRTSATHGMGLYLVDNLVHDWGSFATPDSCIVWAEIDLAAVSDSRALK